MHRINSNRPFSSVLESKETWEMWWVGVAKGGDYLNPTATFAKSINRLTILLCRCVIPKNHRDILKTHCAVWKANHSWIQFNNPETTRPARHMEIYVTMLISTIRDVSDSGHTDKPQNEVGPSVGGTFRVKKRSRDEKAIYKFPKAQDSCLGRWEAPPRFP